MYETLHNWSKQKSAIFTFEINLDDFITKLVQLTLYLSQSFKVVVMWLFIKSF